MTMSLGYAEKLSYIEDVGKVGMTEYFDTPHILQEKVGGFFFLITFLFLWVFIAFVCASSFLVICPFGFMTLMILRPCDTHECQLIFFP